MSRSSGQPDERNGESGVKFIAKFGALYSGIVALVSDILQPLFEFTLIFLVICAVALVGEIALGFYTSTEKGRPLNEKLKELTDGHWLKAILGATVLSFCVLLGMFLLNDDTEDGFLAEHSEAVKALQKDLGILKEHVIKISKDTHEIARNTDEIAATSRETAENTKVISEKSEKIAENTKETSEHSKKTADNTGKLVEQGEKTNELLEQMVNPADARKKLAQLGVPYTMDGYRSKVMEGDLETLKLFYQAGWNPLSTSGSWPGVSPIFLALAQQTPNYLEVLAQAIEEGKYDPNKKIRCNIVNAFPQVMELFAWLNAPNVWININHDKIQEANLGYLISVLIRIPDESVCSFVKAFHLDMKAGIAFRNSIINKNYLLKEFKKFQKKMLASIPGGVPEPPDSALMRILFPPENEKLFQQRSKEYRKGTQTLAAAAGIAR